jgi:D-3-phosphoglycerate dehydrogenase / 2-oxoglutarate reductase
VPHTPQPPTRFAATLPPWATATQYDPSLGPVDTQVGPETRVIIPATAPAPIMAAAVAAAPNLALIVQPASGLDNVDVAAATARGIPVCAAAGVNAASVAEAAIMSLLAVARRLDAARAALAARTLGNPLGTQLCGKRLVVVGAGAIGGRVATIGRAIGMDVTCLSSSSTRADLEAALNTADAVSLHCPLTPATRHLFDRAAFAALKPGALFVNYSRGGVVDEAALLDALNSGVVAGAGLDVFETEPVDPASPLASHPAVLATPHIGVATHDVWAAYKELLAGNVIAAREGGALKGQVNQV